MVRLKYKGLRTFKGVPCGVGALQRFYGISRYQYKLYLEGGLKGAFSEDKSSRIEKAIEMENTREDLLRNLAEEAQSKGGKVDSSFMKKVEKTAIMPLSIGQLYEFLKLELDNDTEEKQ